MVEPLAVAVHSVRKVPAIEGRPVMVVGAGTIGQCIAQTAREAGAGEILIADRVPFRLSVARKLGFTTLVVAASEPLEAEAERLLGGRKPPVIFECAETQSALNGCIRAVERGGLIVVVGVYEEPPVTEMVLVQDKEITLAGALMYTWGITPGGGAA
jgi:L-iditol 2-dehydrogenase